LRAPRARGSVVIAAFLFAFRLHFKHRSSLMRVRERRSDSPEKRAHQLPHHLDPTLIKIYYIKTI